MRAQENIKQQLSQGLESCIGPPLIEDCAASEELIETIGEYPTNRVEKLMCVGWYYTQCFSSSSMAKP